MEQLTSSLHPSHSQQVEELRRQQELEEHRLNDIKLYENLNQIRQRESANMIGLLSQGSWVYLY